jgi:hypothetical protein
LAFGLLLPLCLFRRKVNLFCLTLLIALEVQWHSCKSCNRTHQSDFTVSHTRRKCCTKETSKEQKRPQKFTIPQDDDYRGKKQQQKTRQK